MLIIYMLGIVNVFFPRVFIPIIFYLYINKHKNKVLKYSLIYSLSLLAFSYRRLGETGDLVKYENSFYNFYKINGEEAFKFIEGKVYYTWNILNLIISKLNLKFEYVTLISMILFFFSIFSIIELIDLEKNILAKKKITIKFFIVILIFIVFSSYKNIIAFTVISYGLYLDFLTSKKGILYKVVGLGFHISGIMLIILELLSRKIKIKKKYYIICFFVGLMSKYIITFFCNRLDGIFPYLSEKIRYYTFGEWAYYNFQSVSDIVSYYLVFIILLTALYSLVDLDSTEVSITKRYNNFIKTYICFILLIIQYRTFTVRFIYAAFPIFLLLFYQNIVYLKKKFLKYIWILMIDLRIFIIPFSNGYQIGKGFLDEIVRNIFNIFFY